MVLDSIRREIGESRREWQVVLHARSTHEEYGRPIADRTDYPSGAAQDGAGSRSKLAWLDTVMRGDREAKILTEMEMERECKDIVCLGLRSDRRLRRRGYADTIILHSSLHSFVSASHPPKHTEKILHTHTQSTARRWFSGYTSKDLICLMMPLKRNFRCGRYKN